MAEGYCTQKRCRGACALDCIVCVQPALAIPPHDAGAPYGRASYGAPYDAPFRDHTRRPPLPVPVSAPAVWVHRSIERVAFEIEMRPLQPLRRPSLGDTHCVYVHM